MSTQGKLLAEMQDNVRWLKHHAESVMPSLQLGALATAQEHLYNMGIFSDRLKRNYERLRMLIEDDDLPYATTGEEPAAPDADRDAACAEGGAE